MLKYLGTLKNPNSNEIPSATTFHIKFVDDNKLTETKIGELKEFMSKYHSSAYPEIPITWNLKYNHDSSVKIQLKLHYPDIERTNDKRTQEKIMMSLTEEFEEVYNDEFC
jgi:hypothetical protein